MADNRYNQTEFAALSDNEQVKVILDMLSDLEDNIADNEFTRQAVPSIISCYKIASSNVQKEMHNLDGLELGTLPHAIIRIIDPILRRLKKNYNGNDPQIYSFGEMEKSPLQKVPFPITVIADNIRSRYNLGSIYRTAECVSARWMYLCGISDFPPLNAFLNSAKKIDERVPYTLMYDTKKAIEESRKKGIPIIALETTSNAKLLFEYKPVQPIAVILGNEALGIEEDIIKLADEVLYIPVFRWKNVLNVSNAFTLAAYWLSGIVTTY